MRSAVAVSLILSLLLLGCVSNGVAIHSTTSAIQSTPTPQTTSSTLNRQTPPSSQPPFPSSKRNYGNNQYGGYGYGGNFQKPVSCPNNGTLTFAPADPNEFDNIIPLGNLNPPGHTFPADHLYFSFKTQSGNPKDFNSPTLPVHVFAPAEVTLIAVREGTSTTASSTSTDYRLDFTPCPGVTFYYDHIAFLDPKIQAALKAIPSPECGESNQAGQGYKACFYRISLSLKAGDPIGVAGGPGTNPNLRAFDFGGYDVRTPELAFIDKQRITGEPDQFLHSVCPLDYYQNSSLRATLYQKVQNTRINADGLPDCGSPMQDVPGTIQGNWNAQNSPVRQGPQDWNTQLAIVHLNTDPSQGVISLGGTLTQGGRTQFTAVISGSVNREPSHVTADGNMYCYQGQQISYGQQSPGHFLFQLIVNNTLKAEYLPGSCSEMQSFQHPTTYVR